MSVEASFAGALAEIAGQLSENAPSHALLYRAAGEVDQLGRRLHGLGFVHDREIADCFTAAIGELSACHALAEDERAEPVRRAVRHLQLAAGRAEAGGLSA